MDNNYCCVPQCNSLGSNIPRTSFHRFPTEKDEISKRRREKWIEVLKIGKKVSSRMVVCGKHFQPSDFFPQKDGPLRRTNLKKNAIPSRNLPLTSCENKETVRRKQEKSLLRLERKNHREKLKENRDLAGPSNEGTSDPGLFDDVPLGPLIANSDYDPYQLPIDIDQISAATTVNLDPHELDIGIGSINEMMLQDDEEMLIAAETLLSFDSQNKKDAETQVKSGDLLMCRSFIKNMNEKGLKSLTGLPSFDLLEYLIELLENNAKTKRNQCMPVKDKIILTLMRLKLDISFEALAVFFECTGMTCKNIFNDVLPQLASFLEISIQWLDKEVMNNMPLCFQKYTNTRVVLDCTEITVTKPDCIKCRIMTYSQYKNNHTIKVMVGASPSGLVTFLSPVFGGRTSDKSIFDQSGIIEYLEPHVDAVMVDKGFQIDEACNNAYIELLRPPYLKQKKQFTAAEARENVSIAKARVHVERIIQRIKMFKILEGKLSWGMLPYIKDIFTVCGGIANLGPPILSDDKF